MIRPINNHVLIQPEKRESFIPSDKGNYEEIGIVIDGGETSLKQGWRVYFDSWLVAKFPSEKEGEFYWLVDFKDVRAIDDQVPK